MRSVSGILAEIVFLFQEDLVGRPRVLRCLIAHPDLPKTTWLLPVKGDANRLTGILVEPEQMEPSHWKRVEPPVRWQPGRVPVAVMEEPEFRVLFKAERDWMALRERRLAEEVLAVLSHPERPLMDRAADLEYADMTVGGHPVTTAALLTLAEGADASSVLGDRGKLRRRFHTVALDGAKALERALTLPDFSLLRASPKVDALMGAAVRAATPNGVLVAEAWSNCREQTLWSWWLHNAAATQDLTLRGLATHMGIAPGRCVEIANGTSTPSQVGVEDLLPPRSEALDALAEAFVSHPPQRSRVGFTLRSQKMRLSLFTRQLGELERALGEGKLTRWAEVRREIDNVRGWLSTQRLNAPWQKAMSAAETLREGLMGQTQAQGLSAILEAQGLHLAGATLAYAGQQGAVHREPDASPVVFLTPAALSRTTGAVRFAVLHQLGHLMQDAPSPCTKWSSEDLRGEDVETSDEHEAFANAFAAYFAAPRTAVFQLVQAPQQCTEDWVQGAARDVSVTFGLSAAASVPHVLNCFGWDARPWLAELGSPRWDAWIEQVEDLVSGEWLADREFAERRCGLDHHQTVETALGRPTSGEYVSLLRRGIDEGRLAPELQRAYGVQDALV